MSNALSSLGVKGVFLFVSLLAIGLLPLVGSGSASQQSEKPPAQAYGAYQRRTVEVSNGAFGILMYDVDRKSVDIRWSFGTGLNRHQNTQRLAVRYWPTAACFLGEDRVIVGGREEGTDGDTVIESWTLKHGPLPFPLIDPVTGERVFQDYLPKVLTRKVIYRRDDAGNQYVVSMLPNSGRTDCVFFQFLDSADLYEINVSTEALQKVLSAQEDGSAPFAPQLLHPWNACQYGNHLTHGYVYFFDMWEKYPPVRSMVMIDQDKDGDLDTWYQFASLEEWSAQGFADPDNYEWLR